MTTKQKAKAYDEAWHKAKRIINVCVDDNTECRSMIACIQQIFPELAESEDEKIRKWLIGYFQRNKVAEVIKTHDILAWLEKQGEQILANSAKTCKDEQEPTDEEMKTLLRTEYEKGKADVIAEIQNPAWSEEDECYMSECIGAIATKDGWSFEEKRKTKHWLKSLKDRYSLKPSDEQIKALHDLNLTGNISYAGQGQTLIELYNDLYTIWKEKEVFK